MNYELAKKLKDAGFPLSRKGFDDWCRYNSGMSWERQEDEYAYKPTLSELIEACKKEDIWFRLHYFPNSQPLRAIWVAYQGRDVFKGFDTLKNTDEEKESIEAEGSTPEEAVANLWLALNKK